MRNNSSCAADRSGSSFSEIALRLHLNVDDFDFCARPILLVALGILDRLHDVHSSRDAAKHGVLVVQPRAVHARDEELRMDAMGRSQGEM
jgi:hypothetical protein